MKKKISHIKKCGGCSIQRLIKPIVLFPQYNYKCTKHQVLFQILSSYSLHRLHLHFTPLLDFFITIILPSYFHTPPSGFLFCTFRWPPVQITFSSESKCIKPIPLLYSFRLSLQTCWFSFLFSHLYIISSIITYHITRHHITSIFDLHDCGNLDNFLFSILFNTFFISNHNIRLYSIICDTFYLHQI